MAQYDVFADFYNRDWATEYHNQLIPALEQLVLRYLAPGDTILDVGCGTGQVAAQLVNRGFRVFGVDESAAMLKFARINAPGASFSQTDARKVRMDPPAHASISTFEAVNHMLEPKDVEEALLSMARSCSKVCVFDLLTELAYTLFWTQDGSVEQGGEICRFHSSFDAASGLAACRVRVGGTETVIRERCYDLAWIERTLSATAGFPQVKQFDAIRDLGMSGDVAVGRVFFQCFW